MKKRIIASGKMVADYGMDIGSIWQYRLSSHNLLLTGGQYGIEAALPAIIGYLVVCGIGFYYQSRTH